MDYMSLFEISASGMDFQRTRMEAIASNLANVNTTRGVNGQLYQPLEAIARTGNASFDNILTGVGDISIVERNSAPRMLFNPAHPDADAQGYVLMPNVNPVDEMTNMMTATRAYEANVRVMNASRIMAMRALEIGDSK
ncbi:flagellar basal body rod protein FlgC [Flavobacteriaceae bacterium]|nr:flagellar basal body rod protein FlgC [Flavobacteriaceae bacterium]|tara:strand:- start:3833 stop:4246 length:414 start_codon:yes stop_codon:yes gene_type:complete